MESSKRGQSGRLRTCRSSHVISKPNSRVQQTPPVIRIVHIFAPMTVNTDAANFRDVVQHLTGKHSSSTSSKILKKKICPQIPFLSQKTLKAVHVEPQNDEEEELLSTVLSFCEDQSSSSLSQIMTESDSTSSLDSFCGNFGGFGEIDFLTPLASSTLMLSEFPTIILSSIDSIDYSFINRFN